jgi:hypothetical protein
MKFSNSLYRPNPRGRLASSVFSKNKYGNYEKMFTSPSQPRTALQILTRALFTIIVQMWGATLTQAQRTDWNNAAQGLTQIKDGIGVAQTGFNLFTKHNRNLQDINEAPIADCPVEFTPPSHIMTFTVDIDATPGTEEISVNVGTAIAAGTKVIIKATGVIKSGRKADYMKTKTITVLDHTFVSGGSIKTAYLAVFPTFPPTGKRVGFTAKEITVADGTEGVTYANEATSHI